MNKYWFRKRRGIRSKDLGWGWMPISWEGWTVVGLFLLLIAISGYWLGIYSDAATFGQGLKFFASILLLTGLVSLISHFKCRPE